MRTSCWLGDYAFDSSGYNGVGKRAEAENGKKP